MRLRFWQSDKASVPPAQVAAAPAAPDVPPPPKPAPGRACTGGRCRGRDWAISICASSGTHCCARRRGSSCRRRSSPRCPSRPSTSSSPRYKSEARILVDGRENIFLRPNARAGRRAQGAGCGRHHEPGADPPVARSCARDHPQEQAERTSRNSIPCCRAFHRCARMLALLGIAPRSAQALGRGAGARGLLRAPAGFCGRQIAGHRRRISVARSGARRARRKLDRGRVSGDPAGGQAEPGPLGRPMAGRRDREPAEEGHRSRSEGRGFPRQGQPVHRQQQHHAVEPADGRDQHPAVATRGRRSRTPNPRRG